MSDGLVSIVARLARRENGCEQSHRRGDWHLHDEAVQRLVEQLLPFTRRAAPVAGEGLDVERLERALMQAEVGCIGFAGGFHDGNDPDTHHRRDAKRVAAEYAALAANQPVAEERT